MKIGTTREALIFFQDLRPKAQAVFDNLGWTDEQQKNYRRKLAERSGTHLELMAPRTGDHHTQAAGELLNLLDRISLLGMRAMTDPDATGEMMMLAYKAHRAEVALERDAVKGEYHGITQSEHAKLKKGKPTSLAKKVLRQLVADGLDIKQVQSRLEGEPTIETVRVTVERDGSGYAERYTFQDLETDKTNSIAASSLSKTISDIRYPK